MGIVKDPIKKAAYMERERLRNEKYRLSKYEYKGLKCRIYTRKCKVTGLLFCTGDRSKIISDYGRWVINEYGSLISQLNRYNKRLKPRECPNCGTKHANNIHSKSNSDACSNECRRVLTRENQYKRRRDIHGVALTSRVRESVYQRFGYMCQHCGINTFSIIRGLNDLKEPTIDHVIPVSKGGTNEYHNLQLLCRRCNILKGDKT